MFAQSRSESKEKKKSKSKEKKSKGKHSKKKHKKHSKTRYSQPSSSQRGPSLISQAIEAQKAKRTSQMPSTIQGSGASRISYNTNDCFKSDLVCEFVTGARNVTYETLLDFQSKYIAPLSRLHQEDTKAEFGQSEEDVFVEKETASYLQVRCKVHPKCRF